MSKKIAIGGDHAGFEYKAEIVNCLQSKGYEVKDFGHTAMHLAIILTLLIQ
jgi:ribose 5-phosphate isomerase B